MTTKKFFPSPEQQAFLDWIRDGSGSCVLEAVAGAGKTTTLVEGVKLMSGSVFLGAYNKKMGDELKSRIAGMQGKIAGTFHSAGFRALARSVSELKGSDGKVRSDAIDDKKVRTIAEDMLVGTADEHTEGLIPAICQLVSLAKQTGFLVRGLVDEDRPSYWAELVSRHDVDERLPEDYPVSQLCALAARALRASNRKRDTIDFDDMVYLPLLLNLRMFRNDWVLIDEAQDTNAVRRELAARMLRPGGRLVAVGDPHQAIYGFTGADNRSLDMIRERFRATTLRLSVSWRCPRSVVAVAREYVGHIRPASTAAVGETAHMTYTGMLARVSPGDAVLCRFNAPLVELCFRLIREGKPAKIEGRAIGEGLIALVGRWKVKTLDALEGRLQKWNDRERAKIEGAAKKDDAKMARHEDKYATILVLLERAREQKMTTVSEMETMIRSMFADDASSPNLVVLASVHKSKGLEWPSVYLLGRGDIMPSPRATQEWQKEQEINLCYVAVTRAQERLVDVDMPRSGETGQAKKSEESKETAE